MRTAALRSASARRRSVVLLWHRVSPKGPQRHEILPTVALDVFREQLALVRTLGPVVPLSALDDTERSQDGRPRFALTFDDDDARHADHVMPVLQAAGLTATFFLSGRWLHGRGPYWWELLEDEIAADGAAAVARRHGLSEDLSAPQLGEALTGTPAARLLAERARGSGPAPMGPAAAAALVGAGMEIGFHTIDHEVLPDLDSAALGEAVERGREQLADALDTAVTRFAYPHGRVCERSSAAVARAGYSSAWTTAKRTTRAGEDMMQRGRWDIGYRSLGEAERILVRGLSRPNQ